MKGAAQFYADLVRKNRPIIGSSPAPANSPENHFQMTNGQQAAVYIDPTMVQQAEFRYLFESVHRIVTNTWR